MCMCSLRDVRGCKSRVFARFGSSISMDSGQVREGKFERRGGKDLSRFWI